MQCSVSLGKECRSHKRNKNGNTKCVRTCTHTNTHTCVCKHMRGKILSHTWSMRATERFPKEVQEPPQLSKEN